MKLHKKVDRQKGIDTYTLEITHSEADVAFQNMSLLEQETAARMQMCKSVSQQLKILALWATRIETSEGVVKRPPGYEEEMAKYEG